VTRSGARPGDLLMVSGVPGEAAAGLHVIQQHMPLNETTAQLQWRFLRPRPRVVLGRQLRTVATAAMDVSDGLLTDLQKLCAASHCGAVLDVDALPPSPAMRELFDADTVVDYALAGGDDYELLFTLPRERLSELMAQRDPALPLTVIGAITAGGGVQCTRYGAAFTPRRSGYDHFAGAQSRRAGGALIQRSCATPFTCSRSASAPAWRRARRAPLGRWSQCRSSSA
jgi:thiamine-monophosphate kinase